MFDVDQYLQRIGCAGETGVDAATLRKLHKAHLMALPYNGAAQDLADGIVLVDIDEDAMFERTVVDGRGGTCFQLARLFNRLLRELGYDVTLMAASTAEGRENIGLDVEHMFNRVAVDGQVWVVDVGYPGPSFIEPLLLTEGVQSQYGCQYRLVEHGDGYALQRRGRVSRWSVVYHFTMDARTWEDWRELEVHLNERYARTEPAEDACPIGRGTDRLFSQIEADTAGEDLLDVLIGRTIDNGQVVLKGKRYLTVRDGREEVRTITDDDEQRELITSVLSGRFS
ncbi:arylamine N-acetyltransferase family protein [Actinokineospora pegani]|uniref:arylamine N-acetyltransferase family protein n=1 Tax=Actinokineospora pegani TaxID=2654637 RepID=UPI0012E99B93|nr:arylamine N-acetyltransferase [Actinokineospora pegani]